jgi:hypothetical protein
MKTHAAGKITLLVDKEEWCMECKLKLKDFLKLEVLYPLSWFFIKNGWQGGLVSN